MDMIVAETRADWVRVIDRYTGGSVVGVCAWAKGESVAGRLSAVHGVWRPLRRRR